MKRSNEPSNDIIILVFIAALAIVTFLPKAQAEPLTSEQLYWQMEREHQIRKSHPQSSMQSEGVPIFSPHGLEGWATQYPDGSVYFMPFDAGTLDPAIGGLHAQ